MDLLSGGVDEDLYNDLYENETDLNSDDSFFESPVKISYEIGALWSACSASMGGYTEVSGSNYKCYDLLAAGESSEYCTKGTDSSTATCIVCTDKNSLCTYYYNEVVTNNSYNSSKCAFSAYNMPPSYFSCAK